jgi:hypothetical protein
MMVSTGPVLFRAGNIKIDPKEMEYVGVDWVHLGVSYETMNSSTSLGEISATWTKSVLCCQTLKYH